MLHRRNFNKFGFRIEAKDKPLVPFITKDWSNGNRVEWFSAKCECGEKLKMLNEFRKDMIQADDDEFRRLYPNEYANIERQKEKEEQSESDKIKVRDNLYKKFGWDNKCKAMLDKMYA